MSAPFSLAIAAHPTLCGRCTSNLFGVGESRHVA